MTAARTGRPAAGAGRRTTLHRPNLRLEKELLRGGCTRLATMDKVGRGALAGPVTVGVVVVTASIGRVPAGLRDSKLLTPAARDRLVAPVRRWAVEWAVGHAGPDEIDAYGIMTGLRMAARRALGQLSGPVDAVLLDGNHDYLNAPAQATLFEPVAGGDEDTGDPCSPGPSDAEAEPTGIPVTAGIPVTEFPPLPVHVRIKADLHCAGVAAASVLAKTTRDALMVGYADEFPAYGWAVNKGYATPEHLAAIAEHGPCERHRRSWRLSGPLPATDMGDDEGTVEFAAAASAQQPTMDLKGAWRER